MNAPTDLTNLRDDFINLGLHIEALCKAQEETKATAKERALAYRAGEEGALDDLKALDRVYKSREGEIADKRETYDYRQEQIKAWYQENRPLDWTFKFVPGSLWDGWYCRSKPGNVMIIDKELTSIEIETIKALCTFRNLYMDRCSEGIRLRAQAPVYREVCWSDYSAEVMRTRMLRWFEKEQVREAAIQNLDLAVLKD